MMQLKFQSEYFLCEKYENEYVALNFWNGNYYRLNHPAYMVIELFKVAGFIEWPEDAFTVQQYETTGLHGFLKQLISEQIIVSLSSDESEETSGELFKRMLDDKSFRLPQIRVFQDLHHILKLKEVFHTDKTGWPEYHG